MFDKRLRPPGETDEARRIGREDLVPAHAIEHDHNDATHEAPFFTIVATNPELARISIVTD